MIAATVPIALGTVQPPRRRTSRPPAAPAVWDLPDAAAADCDPHDASGELVLRAWDTLRVMGVLQRIALAFGAAAVIVWGFGRRGPRAVLWAAALLLIGYWGACHLFGCPDPYSLEGFFGTALDRALISAPHLYTGEGVPFDPEGLASTIPAVAQVLHGRWVGDKALCERVDPALVARFPGE